MANTCRLFVDSIQVSALAQRVNEQLGDKVLVTPTLWLGSSHHHIDFPGTLSLPPTLYTQVIQNMVSCVLRAGFKRVFLLNGHGGNEVPISQALAELVAQQDDADAACLGFGSWWKIAEEALKPGQHGMATPGISHACEYETSAMLALRPDLVESSMIEECPPAINHTWYNSEYGGRINLFHRYHRFSKSGSQGSPSRATAAKGHSMLDAVVDEVTKLVLDMASWPEVEIKK